MQRHVDVEWWRPDVGVEHRDRGTALAAALPQGSESAVPFWALMVFTFILLLAPQTYFPVLGPLRIALLTAVLGIAAYLFDKFRHGRPIMMHAREMWIAVCLSGWAVVTVPFSYWPGGSASFLFGDYFKTLVVFWLLSHTVNTLVRLRQIVWWLSLIAVPLALTPLQNYLSGVVFVQGEFTRAVGNEAALIGNPNDLALMLNLILPLSVALFLANRKPLPCTVLLAAIGLIIIAVILTYSRAGFLTLATIFVMYQWKLRNRPERRWAWVALVVSLMCVPFLPSSYFDRLSTITDINADRTGSSQERWINMVAAVSHVMENPLVGAGPGMNILAMNKEGGAQWRAVHNVYLEYAVDLGLPGLALFLLLFAGCMKNTVCVQHGSAAEPPQRELFLLAEGTQISLIAFAVAGLFHPVAYHFYFYYIAGLAVATKTVHEIETRRS